MPDAHPILQVKDLVKAFPAPSGHPVRVLDGISFSLNSGETMAVIGPSGSGKSTLLNVIGTLDTPTNGSVTLADQDLSQLSPSQTARLRNTEIGFIFQDHHLLPQCTAIENVMMPTLAQPKSRRDLAAWKRAHALFEATGIAERKNFFPGQLSGGERQRVAVIRSLIMQPQLILADEPTGALDKDHAEALADLLCQLNRDFQTTMIVVTHAPELARRMHRTCCLIRGKLEPSD